MKAHTLEMCLLSLFNTWLHENFSLIFLFVWRTNKTIKYSEIPMIGAQKTNDVASKLAKTTDFNMKNA